MASSKLRSFTLSAAAIIFFSLMGRVEASEKTQVQWAGISLAGSFEQLPKLMPTTYDLVVSDVNFRNQLAARLARVVTDHSKSLADIQIVVDGQMRQGDDSFAMTFAISGESVTSYCIEKTTFVDYAVQALVLIANVSKDPSRQRIVASYPVQVRYQHAYPDGAQPTVLDRREIIGGMLMGSVGKADAVAEWKKTLAKVRLRDKEVWISVAPLVILPNAEQQGGFTKEQSNSIAFKVSSVIEGNISSAADIPIVPSTYGGAIDQLTLSFADRGIVAFRKPDPSYVFQVSIYALASNALEHALTRETQYAVAYGGGFEVEYFSVGPDRDRKLEFGMKLQSVQSVSYLGSSRDAHRTTSADMFSRLISSFADELSINLMPANLKWIEKSKASSETRSAQDLAKLITKKLPRAKGRDL